MGATQERMSFRAQRGILLSGEVDRSSRWTRGLVEERTRTRFLAEFTLRGQSEILRCAQDDSEGLGMAMGGLTLACHRYSSKAVT